MVEKNSQVRSNTFICSRNTLDGVYPPMILALQSVRKGANTAIFFTFNGLDVVKKGGIEKVKYYPPGFLGAIPGVPTLATKMMLKMAEEKAQVPVPKDLLEMCYLEGVKLWACKMTMDMMGLTEDDLIEGVKVTDAPGYLDMAFNAHINMFM
ncbi:MAG: DsrE/DsrF/DrsH-like family protein [Peptococcaceae bacterium]|nr:DsrE/DsrF/DrsH-like family protein [Peptococcaceae bacterium]